MTALSSSRYDLQCGFCGLNPQRKNKKEKPHTNVCLIQSFKMVRTPDTQPPAYSNYLLSSKVCGHLSITTICMCSQWNYDAAANTEKTFDFTETKKPKHVPPWQFLYAQRKLHADMGQMNQSGRHRARRQHAQGLNHPASVLIMLNTPMAEWAQIFTTTLKSTREPSQ